MQLMVYIYYCLLFLKNDNLKYTAISQRRSFNSFLFFFYILFSLIVLCFYYIFSNSLCTKKHHVYNLYRISYTLSFYYVMFYIVLEIFNRRRFLELLFLLLFPASYICRSQRISDSL